MNTENVIKIVESEILDAGLKAEVDKSDACPVVRIVRGGQQVGAVKIAMKHLTDIMDEVAENYFRMAAKQAIHVAAQEPIHKEPSNA